MKKKLKNLKIKKKYIYIYKNMKKIIKIIKNFK